MLFDRIPIHWTAYIRRHTSRLSSKPARPQYRRLMWIIGKVRLAPALTHSPLLQSVKCRVQNNHNNSELLWHRTQQAAPASVVAKGPNTPNERKALNPALKNGCSPPCILEAFVHQQPPSDPATHSRPWRLKLCSKRYFFFGGAAVISPPAVCLLACFASSSMFSAHAHNGI